MASYFSRNRYFTIALAISAFCHLACMSFVTIVILPERAAAHEYTSVSFLGPILEKTALEIVMANKPAGIETRYSRLLLYRGDADIGSGAAISIGAGGILPSLGDAAIGSFYTASLSGKKALPPPGGSKAGSSKPDKGIPAGDEFGRRLIYRPAFPELPPWVDGRLSYTVELRFKISGSGDVEAVEPFVSSGLPDVDMIGIRYVKSWRFEHLADGAAADDGWKVVRLTLGGAGRR